MNYLKPKEAVIAVTLNCNARCVMCNIWQNKIKDEVPPKFYRKLPNTLKEINITGGEPYLRNDLPEIIQVIKKACPHARLILNTNGYLINQIKNLTPLIIKYDPWIALRVSLDGFGNQHDKIRRLPNFFKKAIESLNYFQQTGIKDLGISYTLMEENKDDLLKIYNYCEKNNLEFSLTVATDSPIYFGLGKINLRPKFDNELIGIFARLTKSQYRSIKPKNWVRAWFNEKLLHFIEKKTRYFTCNAGEDFFYLDSLGKVYTCHLKSWQMGNLSKESFEKIYFSKNSDILREKTKICNDCWMVCTARSSIKRKIFLVFKEILINKLSTHFNS